MGKGLVMEEDVSGFADEQATGERIAAAIEGKGRGRSDLDRESTAGRRC